MEEVADEVNCSVEKPEHAAKSATVHAGGDSVELEGGTLSNTKELFMNEVKNILEELDEKRESDKRVVNEFRSKMNEMTDEICDQIEQRLADRYQKTNAHVQSKLGYLNEILGRVTTLEQELTDFNSAVSVFFQAPPK